MPIVSKDTGKQSCASLSSVEFAVLLILGEKPGLPTSWGPLPALLQYELCPRHHLQRIWKADPAAARDRWQLPDEAFPGNTVSHFLGCCRRWGCAATALLCRLFPGFLQTRSPVLCCLSFCSPLSRGIRLSVTVASADCVARLPASVTPLSPSLSVNADIDRKSAF